MKRIKTPERIDEDIKIVLYGPSGTGKTTIASTFPGPILHLDIKERTAKSLRGVKGLETISIRTWKDFEDVYWFLKDEDKYKTVVIDTVSQLQDLAIANVLQQRKRKLDGKRAGDWGTLKKQDWGAVASDMKTWLMNYRDLEMNVVFIAQDRVFKIEEEDEDLDVESEGGNIITTPEVGPQVMPSVAKTLNAMVDIIGNTFIMETYKTVEVMKGKVAKKRKKRVVDYCLRLGPHAIYRTKFRKPKSTKTASYIVDPTYEKIVAMERGETRGEEA